MKRILHISLLSLFLFGLTNQLSASEQLSELPSEATMNEINSSYSSGISTFDWWEEGPPGEGGGGGGAVGVPMGEGLLPLSLAGLSYLLFLIVRRRRSSQEG